MKRHTYRIDCNACGCWNTLLFDGPATIDLIKEGAEDLGWTLKGDEYVCPACKPEDVDLNGVLLGGHSGEMPLRVNANR